MSTTSSRYLEILNLLAIIHVDHKEIDRDFGYGTVPVTFVLFMKLVVYVTGKLNCLTPVSDSISDP